MLYTGPMFIGSNQEQEELIYDTGSDWLVVEGADCRSCWGSNYNATASTSWEADAEPKMDTLMYGSAYIEGMTGTDDVCLDDAQSNCVNKQEIFLVDYQFGLPPDTDGILGLCHGGELDFDNISDYADSDDEDEEEESDDDDDEDGGRRGRGDRIEDYVEGALFANGLFDGDKITENSFSFYLADNK